ncbi:hypothetical protein RN001_012941 [Aquatica leii]|uniref:Ionotropic glutamate receptor C-terminal domain-containing protein n=1 Tax=Aquatica leii TaxID=1421715 RepID=A0AAN7P1J1_9COLE|nr:hypothetical protein RN001_012941 [Aquatica leii]
MLITFVVILTLSGANGVVLNPNGPLHQKYSTGCIMRIVENEFDEKNKLFTILTTKNLSTKAFQIQEKVILNINKQSKWSVEIINGKKHNFRSSKLCLNCPLQSKNKKSIIKHNFQLHYKTTYCVVVVDNVRQFEKALKQYLKSDTYNYHVYFLVYVAEVVPNYKNVAKEILLLLWKCSILKTAVLIPRYSLTTFTVYGLNVFAPSEYCGQAPTLQLLDVCQKGSSLENTLIFDDKVPKTFHNCSITTIAMKYPPFVVNENMGFEVRVLKELGHILDIRFKIEIQNAVDWGVRISPNNWTGPLERVYKESAIAIGNVIPNAEYALDFDLSIAYFYEHMVWVVPAALPIPRWKNIFVIFSFELWLACFGFYLLSAVLLYALSRCAVSEYKCYKELSLNLIAALGLLVGVAIAKQPKTLGTRSIFISVAAYSMILAVLYQTVLMSHLLNPVYESQIETVDDIFDSGMGIGGIKSFREFFNVSNDKKAMRIYDIFEIYEEINDTAFNWLITVADDRDTCTLSSSFYTKYLMNANHSVFVNRQGDEKIYILKELIFSYPVQMIQPRGFLLEEQFDKVIWKLINGGLIQFWANKYQEYSYTDVSEDDDTQLTMRHLQGAFMLLFFGYAFATVAFIGELISKNYKRKNIRKRLIRVIKLNIIKKSK